MKGTRVVLPDGPQCLVEPELPHPPEGHRVHGARVGVVHREDGGGVVPELRLERLRGVAGGGDVDGLPERGA